MKISSDSMMAMVRKAVRPSQGACRFEVPCSSISPSEGDPGGRPSPRKSSDVSVVIEPLQDEGQERQGRHHGVGQDVLHHDAGVRQAQGAGGVHIFEVPRAQELGPHEVDEVHPGEQQQDAEQHEERRRDHGRHDDQNVEMRQRGPDLDHALHDEVGPAAEIALHGPGRDADDGRDAGQQQREHHRQAEPVDQPGQDVAPVVVGAEPVRLDGSARMRGGWRAALVRMAFTHCASVSIQVGGDGRVVGGDRLRVVFE